MRRDELVQQLVDEFVHHDPAGARTGATDLSPDDVDLMPAEHCKARGVRMKVGRENVRHGVPVGMDVHEERARRHARKDLPQVDQLRTDDRANGVDHFGGDGPASCDDAGFARTKSARGGRRSGRLCRLFTSRRQQADERNQQSTQDTWQEHEGVAS